jgi:hypothetical protein
MACVDPPFELTLGEMQQNAARRHNIFSRREAVATIGPATGYPKWSWYDEGGLLRGPVIMRRLPLLILALCLGAAPPPATAPSNVEQLDGGRVRLVAPQGWTLVHRGGDGLSLAYRLGEGEDAPTMNVHVTVQEATTTRDSAAKMAMIIGKQLRDSATASNAKFLSQPRVIPDDRFLLTIHDRVRSNDNKVRDQVQVYRALAGDLLHVATVAVAEDDESAAPVHAAGAAVADSAKLGAGPKPVVFRRTRVRMTIPPDWVEQRSDDPNGVVATFTNPQLPGALLVVRAKTIPRDARGNADVQRNSVDMLVDDYRNAAVPAGASAVGEEEPFDRPPFAKHLMRSLDWDGQAWGTDFRARVTGNVAIGVEALSPPGDTLVARLADQMALSIKSLDDTKQVGELKLSPAAEKVLADRRERQRLAATQRAASGPASQPTHSADTSAATTSPATSPP